MFDNERQKKLEKYKNVEMENYIKQIEESENQFIRKVKTQKGPLTTIKNIIFNETEEFPFFVNFDIAISYFDQLQVKKLIALSEIQKKIDKALQLDESKKLAEVLFWFIFAIAYPEQCGDRNKILTQLRYKQNQIYFKIIKIVQNDIVMNYWIFQLGYVINLAFYIFFDGSRQQFNNKFITYVYVIMLKELNGIDSNYLYLKSSLEKNFQMNNYLKYKDENKKDYSMLKVSDASQQTFYQDSTLSFSRKNSTFKTEQFMLDLFNLEQKNLVLKILQVLKSFLIVFRFHQLFKIYQKCIHIKKRKDQQLPDNQSRHKIKHHQYSNQKENQFKQKINQIKFGIHSNDFDQTQQFKQSHKKINNNYIRNQLYNINVKQIDYSLNLKYPKYQQFFSEEIELKQILTKNAMRMTDLKTSKQVYFFNIRQQNNLILTKINKNRDNQNKQDLKLQYFNIQKKSLNIKDDFVQNLRVNFEKKMIDTFEIQKTKSVTNLKIQQENQIDDEKYIQLKDRLTVNQLTNLQKEVQSTIRKQSQQDLFYQTKR